MDRVPSSVLARWHAVGEIADRLEVKAWIVGGSVRDACLGLSSHEMDIAVIGSPHRLATGLVRAWGGEIKDRSMFQTLSLRGTGLAERIDVAMVRAETYPAPGALPVVRAGTMEEDAWRRDVSVNAMAVGLNRRTFGKLWDPAGGRQDLVDRRIRILHEKSFEDDPTRLFRAVRYEQRLGWSMDSLTESLVKQSVETPALIQRVSNDRWEKEWAWLMREECPWNGFDRLGRLGVLRWFGCGGAKRSQIREWFTVLSCLGGLEGSVRMKIPLAWWLAGMVWVGGARAKELRVSRPMGAAIERLASDLSVILRRMSRLERHAGGVAVEKALKGCSTESIELAAAWKEGTPMGKLLLRYIKEWEPLALSVTGDDIRRWGIPPGPAYKIWLEKVRRAVLTGAVESGRDSELSYLRHLVRGR